VFSPTKAISAMSKQARLICSSTSGPALRWFAPIIRQDKKSASKFAFPQAAPYIYAIFDFPPCHIALSPFASALAATCASQTAISPSLC
jgi:hypothetical protein